MGNVRYTFFKTYICNYFLFHYLFVFKGIDNKTDEIEASQSYTNIRMFRIGSIPSGQPENDLISLRDYWDEWVDPTTDGWKYGKYLLDFSAICFLFARGMSDHLGNKPLGLIASSYAGTRIEAWSPPETLDTCGIEDYIDVNHDYNSNSHLYNAMIHPFHKMSIKGAVWYQGEANSFWNPDKYQCMLKNMLDDWRNRWSQNSGTSLNFPVGLVQLGPLANPPEEKETRKNDGSLFPLIRWHQTMDQGFLPNSEEQNGFSAVSFDTYYNGTVHPHNKQLPAQRLAIAGLSIAYGLPNYPSKGPFPTNFEIIETETGGVIVQIEYDEDPISYKPGENSGFFFCCGENSSSSCEGDQVVPATNWKLVSTEYVEQTYRHMITITLPNCNGPSSLGYLWAESPVTVTHGLPIYSTNNYELPAAPWWKKL